MMRRYINFILILIIFKITACEEKPEPNPCMEAKPVTAEFVIYEFPALGYPKSEFNWKWTNIDTDTILIINNRAIFSAVQKDAEYEWIIGNEILKTKDVYREEFPLNKPITITLKVIKTPNSACFPNDDGIDIKTRIFYVISDDKSKILGDYEGYDMDLPKEKISFSFQYGYYSPIYPMDLILRITMPNGCYVYYDNAANFKWTYKQFYFGHNINTDCLRPMGLATVYSTNYDSIRIDYSVQKIPNNIDDRVPKTFKGKRKQ